MARKTATAKKVENPAAVANGTDAPEPAKAIPTPRSSSHMFGEIVFLLTQSPIHKFFSISDLEWMVMPALALKQFRSFYENDRIIAAAFWGFLSEEAEAKLIARHPRLRPDEWRSGDRTWLVELVAPSATPENKIIERVLSDLSTSALKGHSFKFFTTDPATGTRKVNEINPATETLMSATMPS